MGKRKIAGESDNVTDTDVVWEPRERGLVKDVQKIYIGPSLRGVAHGTVFQNGLSPALEDMACRIPAVAELVVPINQLRQANRELEDPDSVLSRFFRMVETSKEGE